MNTWDSQARRLAETGLRLGIIRIDPAHPFTWASGCRMPVYNDCRLLLSQAGIRLDLAESMQARLDSIPYAPGAVAGAATAGIPHATALANRLQTPLVYVRPAAKGHGLQNQIEGGDVKGKKLVVVEDLVSTGESALKVVRALREAGALVDHCLCIFSYGFPEAGQRFQEESCRLHPLLTFPFLLEHLKKEGQLDADQVQVLEDWVQDPFGWAGRHGFAGP
ncbi:MAG: orotate phosphoribosyltransferase [Nitrospinaceae bacterium]